MGTRADLPLERPPRRGAVTLAPLLQRAQTTQLARRPATHQPCPQRPEAGHLAATYQCVTKHLLYGLDCGRGRPARARAYVARFVPALRSRTVISLNNLSWVCLRKDRI